MGLGRTATALNLPIALRGGSRHPHSAFDGRDELAQVQETAAQHPLRHAPGTNRTRTQVTCPSVSYCSAVLRLGLDERCDPCRVRILPVPSTGSCACWGWSVDFKERADLEVTEATLYYWVRQDKIDGGELPGRSTGESKELAKVKRRIREFEAEVEILRRANQLLGSQVVRLKGFTR